jgi:hypothetical protein
MHPVNYLFEDIYRNDWSIGSGRQQLQAAGQGKPMDSRPSLPGGA